MAHTTTTTTTTYTVRSAGYADARQTDCRGADIHKVDGYLIIATDAGEARGIAADLKAKGITPLHPNA